MNIDKFLSGGKLVCIKTHKLCGVELIPGNKYNSMVNKFINDEWYSITIELPKIYYSFLIRNESNKIYLLDHFMTVSEYRKSIIYSMV